MKTIDYYDVVSSSYVSLYDQCSESIGKYSTYEEAKKHFDWYVENNVKNNEIFCKHITKLTDSSCSYNDGGDWSYSLNIWKDTFKLKDKFNEYEL